MIIAIYFGNLEKARSTLHSKKWSANGMGADSRDVVNGAYEKEDEHEEEKH